MRRALILLTAMSLFADVMYAVEERSPWFGNFLEFESSLSYTNATAKKVNVHDHERHKHLDSRLVSASLSFTATPEDEVALLLTGGNNSGLHEDKHFSWRSFSLQYRHLFMNDILGDPLSISAGLALNFSSRQQLRDLLQIQQSSCEAIAHIALGREFFSSERGYLHLWALGLFGSGLNASGWCGEEAHVDWVIGNDDATTHRVGVLARASQGLGSHALSLHDTHRPYAHTRFRLLDVGASYRFYYNSLGAISFELLKRVHARECPTGAVSACLRVTIPFSF